MKFLHSAKRVTIKIGSSLIVDQKTGLKTEWFNALCRDVAELMRAGKEIILVSSGAVAFGRHQLGFTRENNPTLAEKQAAASVGQIGLAKAYQDRLALEAMHAGQLLVTFDDTEDQRRFMNVRATLDTLLRQRIVPIFNENDTVATEELRYGDNDRLSARIATLASSDCLILLSDIKGLYTADPRKNSNAEFINEVFEITPEIVGMAGGAEAGGVGTGGMATKIDAAMISLAGGCHMAIADGQMVGAVGGLFKNDHECTWFIPSLTPPAAQKLWLSGMLRKPRGSLKITVTGATALIDNKSLYPSEVISFEGSFGRGDGVIVSDASGAKLGVGIVNHKSKELEKLIGRPTSAIPGILGYQGRDEVIGGDYFFLKKAKL